MHVRRIQRKFQPVLALWLAGSLFTFLFSANPAHAEDNPTEGWQTKELPSIGADPCFDTTRPNTLYLSDYRSGTYYYNWADGQQTLLNSRTFDLCGPNGQLYAYQDPKDADFKSYYMDGRPKDAPGIRFSKDEPAGKNIDHTPTHTAQDGSNQVYSLGIGSDKVGRLWYSSDGGLNWVERGQQFNGFIKDLVVSAASGRAIYITVVESFERGSDYTQKYSIYFSNDAGVTWEKRSESKFNYGYDTFSYFTLYNLPGQTASVDTLMYYDVTGPKPYSLYKVSFDGGRIFQFVTTGYISHYSRIANTNKGLVLAEVNTFTGDATLKISTDQTKTWQDLKTPEGRVRDLWTAPAAPDNLFISIKDSSATWIYHSPDGGQTWQKLGRQLGEYSGYVYTTPYLPLTLLSNRDGKLYTLPVNEVGQSVTAQALPNRLPDDTFYTETNHNLSGPFKSYWQANGGLAVFGYPRTEPFREYNPADGRIYVVQYFERNRFEYHPELAGTKYEVLLGLLGNQLTETRRAAGEGAFNHFDNANYPGGTYYSQTGHNLRNSFKAYWEANGGLELFGYPISEEFEEVNPDDGKTYVVQYFERNRFEYHPENKGTRYEVLLGLLGNSVLKAKGWVK